jgi:hypothetical protein
VLFGNSRQRLSHSPRTFGFLLYKFRHRTGITRHVTNFFPEFGNITWFYSNIPLNIISSLFKQTEQSNHISGRSFSIYFTSRTSTRTTVKFDTGCYEQWKVHSYISTIISCILTEAHIDIYRLFSKMLTVHRKW